MNDLSKLEQRFLDFDELERSGGAIEILESARESNQLTIVTTPRAFWTSKSESANEDALGIPKSSSNRLGIDWNAIEVSDEYIEDKINRMSRTSESLNKKFKKKAPEKIGENEQPTDYPIIGKKGGGRDYTLAADYTYHAAAGYRITAHKAFITDLSSVPRVFWIFINPDELSLAAPIIHDLLYRNGGVLPQNQVEAYRQFTRDESDLLFLEIMKREGISSWRCKAGYFAVRKFGRNSWRGTNQ